MGPGVEIVEEETNARSHPQLLTPYPAKPTTRVKDREAPEKKKKENIHKRRQSSHDAHHKPFRGFLVGWHLMLHVDECQDLVYKYINV